MFCLKDFFSTATRRELDLCKENQSSNVDLILGITSELIDLEFCGGSILFCEVEESEYDLLVFT